MKKVFIYSFDCERRRLDAERLKNYLLKNGHSITDNPKKADCIIAFTCGVFEDVAEENLNKIKRFRRYKGRLIVAGCLPEIKKKEISKIINGDCISSKNLDKIDSFFPENKIKFKDIEDSNSLFISHNLSSIFDIIFNFDIIFKYLSKMKIFNVIYKKFKLILLKLVFGKNAFIIKIFQDDIAYIRISWGCPNNCSYCSIKRAVGNLKSKPFDTCINEFRTLLDKGYKLFRIIADDVGSYGLDIKKTFPELLDKLTNVPGEYEIIIGGLNPKWAVKYKKEIKEILKRKKIIKIEVPIQSGSSRILRLMKRYPDINIIKETLFEFKEAYPDLIIETHCIVGFPTETWSDFIATLNFIEEVNIDSGFILKYSENDQTEAAKITPRITKKEIIRRIKYSKKFLRKRGYITLYIPKRRNLRFDKFEK